MKTGRKIFSSALSKHADWQHAVREAALKVKEGLKGASCDLLVCFVSESYEGLDPAGIAASLSRLLPHRVLLGCNASGVVSSKNEIEMEPAVSLMGMHLPEVKLFPFSLSPDQISSFSQSSQLVGLLDVFPNDRPHFLCLADPETTDIMRLLRLFNEGYKDLPVVGGLASGGVVGAENWLFAGGAIQREGAAGVALVGDIEFEVIVSQGCRPVGKPYVITKAEGNVIHELAGRSTLGVVQELFDELSQAERALAEQSLSVGLVMDEKKTAFKRGDFLIRNILGFDPDSGTLTVGAVPRVGQTMQFQIRDAKTSSEDLNVLLEKLPFAEKDRPQGALLISCCGRGREFYGHPDHDVAAIQAARGPLPMTGFFANGEIGPIGKKNFVHGYTSSLVIFR